MTDSQPPIQTARGLRFTYGIVWYFASMGALWHFLVLLKMVFIAFGVDRWECK